MNNDSAVDEFKKRIEKQFPKLDEPIHDYLNFYKEGTLGHWGYQKNLSWVFITPVMNLPYEGCAWVFYLKFGILYIQHVDTVSESWRYKEDHIHRMSMMEDHLALLEESFVVDEEMLAVLTPIILDH